MATIYEEQVQKLYISYFGRAADPDGLAFYADSLSLGDTTIEEIASSFAISDEAQVIASLSIADFLSAMYLQAFSRPYVPEVDGTFWEDNIVAGNVSKELAMVEILQGASGSDITAVSNKVTVATAFTEAVAAGSANYSGPDAAAAAKAVLDNVTFDTSTVTTALSEVDSVVATMDVLVDATAPTVSLGYSTDTTSITTPSNTTLTVQDTDTLRIFAAFDEAIDDVTGATITINDGSSNTVSAGIMTKVSTTVYYYDYAVPATNSTSTVTIGAAQDSTGNIISTTPTNPTFTISNGEDTLAPTLLSSSPSDNATDIGISNNVTLTFDEAVIAGTGNIVISDSGSDSRTIAVADSSQVSFSGSTVTINPSANLNIGTTYNVQMTGGVITDAVGNDFQGISGTTTLNFETASVLDTLAPTLISSTPAHDDVKVAIDSNITITFDEAIMAGDGYGSGSRIYISDGIDKRYIDMTDTTQISFSGSTMTINPTTDLNEGATYSVMIGDRDVTDLAGNYFEGIRNGNQFNFTTDATPAASFDGTIRTGSTAEVAAANIWLEETDGAVLTIDFTANKYRDTEVSFASGTESTTHSQSGKFNLFGFGVDDKLKIARDDGLVKTSTATSRRTQSYPSVSASIITEKLLNTSIGETFLYTPNGINQRMYSIQYSQSRKDHIQVGGPGNMVFRSTERRLTATEAHIPSGSRKIAYIAVQFSIDVMASNVEFF